jgi:hypothetical protein
MTTITSRRLLQVSLKAELYEQVRQHCAQLDMPMAIWARELIKRELERVAEQDQVVGGGRGGEGVGEGELAGFVDQQDVDRIVTHPFVGEEPG